MTTDKKKGAERQKKVEKILKAQGFIVGPQPKKVLYIPQKVNPQRRIPVVSDADFFGTFDLVAIHPFHQTLWVQVTGDTPKWVNERKQKIKKIASRIHYSNTMMVWGFHESKGKLIPPNGKKCYPPGTPKGDKRYDPYNFFRVWVWNWDKMSFNDSFRVFFRPEVEGLCWVRGCKTHLDPDDTCPVHQWAGIQKFYFVEAEDIIGSGALGF